MKGVLFMAKEMIYMVTYKDDWNRKHLAFVKGFSEVKTLKRRFEEVNFEITETYIRTEEETTLTF